MRSRPFPASSESHASHTGTGPSERKGCLVNILDCSNNKLRWWNALISCGLHERCIRTGMYPKYSRSFAPNAICVHNQRPCEVHNTLLTPSPAKFLLRPTHLTLRSSTICCFVPDNSGFLSYVVSLWGQVDHCPAWDGAWLTLLCRARKSTSATFDWTPFMADIYRFARASIHTPVSMGDAGSAVLMRGRTVAYQYQSFGPAASRRPTAMLKKLSKLMVFLLGKGGPAEVVEIRDVAIVPPASQIVGGPQAGDGIGEERTVSPGALHLLSLFRGLRTYFHPSNGGRWTTELALVVNYVLKGVASRIGGESVLRELGWSPSTGELSRDDAGLVVDVLLPLVLEMVYSKDPSVGSLANMCLSTLASLSPQKVAPAAAELVLRALDPVASINHTHQVTYCGKFSCLPHARALLRFHPAHGSALSLFKVYIKLDPSHKCRDMSRAHRSVVDGAENAS